MIYGLRVQFWRRRRRNGTAHDVGPLEDADAVIDHILTRCDAVHRQNRPELVRLARRVQAAQANPRDLPRGLAELQCVEWEMKAHTQNEEQGLWPILHIGWGGRTMTMARELMRDKHDDYAAWRSQFPTLMRCHQPSDNDCCVWRALYVGAAKLTPSLRVHRRIDNGILFLGIGE
jgi:regulator of cell morphogenesis and NO signaling